MNLMEALVTLMRAVETFLPPCVFHLVTGFPCPTCGTTRAALSLAEGHLFSAIAFNPLVTLGGSALVVYIVLGMAIYAKTGGFPEPHFSPRGLWLLRANVFGALFVNWFYLIRMGI